MEKHGSLVIRLHLKVALPRRIEESFSRREGRVSSRHEILTKKILNFAKFEEDYAKQEIKNFAKICKL